MLFCDRDAGLRHVQQLRRLCWHADRYIRFILNLNNQQGGNATNRVFAGNTIILCLSTAGLPKSQPYSYATTLVSILSFMAGAFTTAHVSQYLGALRRWVLTFNFLLQTLCIVIGSIIISLHLIPTDNRNEGPSILGDRRIIGALPALAFQSGATIATSRLLGFGNEIPVNVLTSTYAALATDPKVFHWKNVSRNRRVAACACVLAGALCSAWIMKKGPGFELVLWLCVAVKLLIAIGIFVFLKHKESEGM